MTFPVPPRRGAALIATVVQILVIATPARAQGVDVQAALGEPAVKAAIAACGADRQRLCGDVSPGGGRIVRCLIGNLESLTPTCKASLLQAREALRRSGVLPAQ